MSESNIDVVVDSGVPGAGPVEIVITADNAYSFGYGDANGINHFTQGKSTVSAGEIYSCPVANIAVDPDATGKGPEAYKILESDAPPSAYLYVVSWDDLAVTQGVIGQFKRPGAQIYTGDPQFEVCATGINYSAGAVGAASLIGPMQADINAQIAICNAGTGDKTTTSGGWVNSQGAVTPGAVGVVAVGEDNSSDSGSFPIACQTGMTGPGSLGIDAAAKWMWYDPSGVGGDAAFHSDGTNKYRSYLIFRLKAADIPPIM